MKRTRGIKPKFSIGLTVPVVQAGALRLVFPFKRSWPAILIMGVLTTGMCFPLISAFAMFDFGRDQDLFSVVVNIFIGAWALGWLAGVAVLGFIFIALLLGREEVVVRPGAIRVRLGIPGIGIGGEFDAARIRNLRAASPDEKKGIAWRGPHMAFDWSGRTIRFGSYVDEDRARALMGGIETALGTRVATGPPAAGELEVASGPTRRGPPDSGEPPYLPPVAQGSASTTVLVAANLVPLTGVLFLDWRLGDIMILYWAESAVVGVFNVLKMAVIDRIGTLLAGPFFVGHFGAFMAIHFLFVYGLFVRGIDAEGAGIPLAEVGAMFNELWPALVALVVSHGFSFFVNFVGRREYTGRTLRDQMAEPYTRIIVMHVTLIIGGFIVLALKTTMPVLALLIGLKIAADAKAHVKQHAHTRSP